LYDCDDPDDQRCEDLDLFIVDRIQASCQLLPSLATMILHRASFPSCCDVYNYITVAGTPLFSNSNFSRPWAAPIRQKAGYQRDSTLMSEHARQPDRNPLPLEVERLIDRVSDEF
jgi:hypothetical protein